jgi:thioredoxin 1
MQVLNSAEFALKLQTGVPMVVDFFAEWCGPCKMLSPILESLAPEFEGKLEIVKVDIDESTELAQQYGITSVPTIIFMKEGKEVDRMVGFQSKDSINSKFNAFIA